MCAVILYSVFWLLYEILVYDVRNLIELVIRHTQTI